MDRETKFCKALARQARIPCRNVAAVLSALRNDDDLLAEMMALCARTNEPTTDDIFEFLPGNEQARFPAYWGHGGSLDPDTGLPWLPMPNSPT